MEETWRRRCLSGDWSESRFEANGGRDANGKERERRVNVMFQVHRYAFIAIIVAYGEVRIFDERQK